MNVHDAKTILLAYRPGTADATDPEIANALDLAKIEPELARWLEAHCTRQFAIGERFRQITVPTGLKEQIICEQSAAERVNFWRPKRALPMVAALIVLLGMLALFWLPKHGHEDLLAIYQNQMLGIALRGYGMDLTTSDPAQIRFRLAQSKAPADFVLSPALQKAAIAGCAVESWQNAKVSMICFRTGKPLPPGEPSDLWLFVVSRSSLPVPNLGESPQFSRFNRLSTAIWTQGDKIYLLGTDGDEPTLRHYL